MIFGLPLVVGDVTVPMWPSVVATLGLGMLAVLLWREQREAT